MRLPHANLEIEIVFARGQHRRGRRRRPRVGFASGIGWRRITLRRDTEHCGDTYSQFRHRPLLPDHATESALARRFIPDIMGEIVPDAQMSMAANPAPVSAMAV
jgi:hypothetical protein